MFWSWFYRTRIFLNWNFAYFSMRLDDIVNSVRHLHTEEIILVRKSVLVPINGKIDDKLEVATTRAIMMGRFYEALTRSLFGGKLGDVYHVRPAQKDVIVRPDIVDIKNKRVFECKSICSGQSGTLLDTQMDGYRGFSLQHSEYEINFAFYRHSLAGIKGEWSGTSRDLFGDLAKRTAYLVVLPFSVVLALHNPEYGSTKFMYRYQGDETAFDTCSCLRSSGLTSFFVSPEKVLEEMGLEVNDYQIDRKMSGECKVQNCYVQSFPVVYVSEKVRDDKFSVDTLGDGKLVGFEDVPF